VFTGVVALASFGVGFVALSWLRGIDGPVPLPAVAAAPTPPRAAPPPPPIPAVPGEILATLPPSVRLGAAAPAGASGADRVIERIEWPNADPDLRGPFEIEYTLDAAMNRRVMEALEPVELGHVVLLDPDDGRVLAYASTEPKSFPATRPYPTASLMKVVTAAAVLEQAPEATQRPCRFLGSPYYLAQNLLDPPSRGHTATFVQALAMSNNQCFAQLAVHELGSLAVVDAMDRLGLLEPPGPGHRPGEVDPVHDRFELGKLGSGLAGSRIPPLAAARLAAVLAEGQVVTPRWIERVRDADGRELRMPEPVAPRVVLRAGIPHELRSMMIETTVRGTARRAFRAQDGSALLGTVDVAGKTGSLNGKNPDGHYEWFIGVAPAENPTIAIATLVVNRGKWRRSASQVAAEVLRSVFCSDGVCRPAPARAVARTSGPGEGEAF
jgi:cell division protein FtsI/penicillin-binding protein 2